ncbi:glutathione S-transferase 1-like [Drosophila ficusphila]|uniref:glutathione S-transferase 1-like n=1 Tax=Drosophila ficusphila TaxID=30025 RepID=UPI0007E806CC|nr:glutathione S-transferase 1-like [Drosophila ficusphila]
MSGIVLYGLDISPPVRSCQLTLRALKLEYEFKEVDLLAGEHRKEEFLQKNPQHTIPLLDDNGVFIWDSHAIVCYLVGKYGSPDDDLYPKDLVKRAHVDQRLYFEASALFMALRNISAPYFYHNVREFSQEKADNVRDGYGHLETFLGDNPYITGDTLTIADFCCAATVSSLPAVVPLEAEKYPKITAWLKRLQELPYYEEANGAGAKKYVDLLKGQLTLL